MDDLMLVVRVVLQILRHRLRQVVLAETHGRSPRRHLEPPIDRINPTLGILGDADLGYVPA